MWMSAPGLQFVQFASLQISKESKTLSDQTGAFILEPVVGEPTEGNGNLKMTQIALTRILEFQIRWQWSQGCHSCLATRVSLRIALTTDL
jgi:hypothetical protein